MTTDYYRALGISKGADLNKIKKAYRQVVKKVHPDVSHSTEDVARFLEIKEAYETLGDEAKRRRYDQQHGPERPKVKVGKTAPAVPPRHSLFNEMERDFSRIDEFVEGFAPGFFDLKRETTRGKDLYFEAVLSPEEARTGGVFPVSIPVSEPCPRCSQASSLLDAFLCPVCSGSGRVMAERTFSLNIPAHVPHGTELRLSMGGIGLKGVSLHVTVLVDPAGGL